MSNLVLFIHQSQFALSFRVWQELILDPDGQHYSCLHKKRSKRYEIVLLPMAMLIAEKLRN